MFFRIWATITYSVLDGVRLRHRAHVHATAA